MGKDEKAEQEHHVWNAPVQNHPSAGKEVEGLAVFPESFQAGHYSAHLAAMARQDDDEENDGFRLEAYFRSFKALTETATVDGRPVPKKAAECSFGLLLWCRAAVNHYLSPFLTANYSPKPPTNAR